MIESELVQASLLYRQSYRILNKVVSEVLSKFNFTPIEWAFLSTIHQKSSLSVSELATLLTVETPMITQLTASEKFNGLISIKRSTTDKRMKSLQLTRKGKTVMLKCETQLQEELEDFFADISRKDIATHLKVLAYIVDREK